MDSRPIRYYEYVGSLLLRTQLELHNTLHLTMSLTKSKLFPEKKLQLGIENAELL